MSYKCLFCMSHPLLPIKLTEHGLNGWPMDRKTFITSSLYNTLNFLQQNKKKKNSANLVEK